MKGNVVISSKYGQAGGKNGLFGFYNGLTYCSLGSLKGNDVISNKYGQTGGKNGLFGFYNVLVAVVLAQ